MWPASTFLNVSASCWTLVPILLGAPCRLTQKLILVRLMPEVEESLIHIALEIESLSRGIIFVNILNYYHCNIETFLNIINHIILSLEGSRNVSNSYLPMYLLLLL